MAKFSVGREDDSEGPSSPRPKKQRTTTNQQQQQQQQVVEDEEEVVESEHDAEEEERESEYDEEEESEEEEDEEEDDQNETETIAGPSSSKDDRDGSISVTLTDPDVLDCPICLEPLSSPVFQLVISVWFCGALGGGLALKLNLAKSEPISFAEVLQVAALAAILGDGEILELAGRMKKSISPEGGNNPYQEYLVEFQSVLMSLYSISLCCWRGDWEERLLMGMYWTLKGLEEQCFLGKEALYYGELELYVQMRLVVTRIEGRRGRKGRLERVEIAVVARRRRGKGGKSRERVLVAVRVDGIEEGGREVAVAGCVILLWLLFARGYVNTNSNALALAKWQFSVRMGMWHAPPVASSLETSVRLALGQLAITAVVRLRRLLNQSKYRAKNLKYGCKETVIYSKKHGHEKACTFAPCSCPLSTCTFLGSSNQLSLHFSGTHPNSGKHFRYNCLFPINLEMRQKCLILKEQSEGKIFVLNNAFEIMGNVVNISCIGPSSSKSSFSYDLIARVGGSSLKLQSFTKNVPRWVEHTPAERFLLVPNNFFGSCGQLKLELCIWRPR
ncbi:protein with RING/U-box and TRAF-like domain [Actinidia rufa]|uniref:Protein with RING/U-box and TRAF-like domain n=1 Tax=Actinidia rufa TaxID=165716 RepID=A0A7J0EJU9_9ERIC|nr:protein with RING/U-box and TRAF-like domain [Actinidia rufa]